MKNSTENVRKYRERQMMSNLLEFKNKECAASKRYYKIHKNEILVRLKKYRGTIVGKYKLYKRDAKYKGRIFSLTEKEFSDIISKPCFYCGEKSDGVDRMDSQFGYVKNNCLPSCTMCNYLKRDYSLTDFLGQCVKIVNNLNEKQ